MANATRAGVEANVNVVAAGVEDVVNPVPAGQRGMLISNPPWGVRMDDRNALLPLYRKMGEVLPSRFPGWKLWLLMGDDAHPEALGLPVLQRFEIQNGPVRVHFCGFELPE